MKLETRLQFRYFLDRQAVTSAVDKMKIRGLKRGGYAVMQAARRSITKMGNAKSPLKIQKASPGMTLPELAQSTKLTKRQKVAVATRIKEVQDRPGSEPGSPPNTHTGMFRNHIVFHWDTASESIVVGQAMPIGDWLARLHEFGGMQSMVGYVFKPRLPNYRTPIVRYWRVGTKPEKGDRWLPLGERTSRSYPPRPYMQPALLNKVKDKTVINAFRLGGM